MGREVRRVPADWEHPKDELGHNKPLLSGTFVEYEERRRQWDNGFVKGYGAEAWDKKPDSGTTFGDWHGEYTRDDFMPDFGDRATHYQMYETCSEGTPISPVFATPEELARWLADTSASAFGGMTATYEAWLRIARGGWACSAVAQDGKLESGVQALLEI
jgi:hypothetical protein